MAASDNQKSGNQSIIHREFLTIDEVSEVLKVPKTWIYQRTRERSPSTIPFYKLGKYLRFDIDEVLAWLREQRRGWQAD